MTKEREKYEETIENRLECAPVVTSQRRDDGGESNTSGPAGRIDPILRIQARKQNKKSNQYYKRKHTQPRWRRKCSQGPGGYRGSPEAAGR